MQYTQNIHHICPKYKKTELKNRPSASCEKPVNTFIDLITRDIGELNNIKPLNCNPLLLQLLSLIRMMITHFKPVGQGHIGIIPIEYANF